MKLLYQPAMTYPEIGAVLGMSADEVQCEYEVAIRKLRKLLVQKGRRADFVSAGKDDDEFPVAVQADWLTEHADDRSYE